MLDKRQKYDYPWTHWVANELITDLDLENLILFAHKKISRNNYGLFYNNDNLPGPIKDIFSRYEIAMQDITSDLEQSYKPPRHVANAIPSCHLAIQPQGYQYRPHCDHPSKIWTFVTYISPSESIGTVLMSNSNGKDSITIDWSLGKTLIFAGDNDVTWHSYQSGNQPRITLCGFMIKPDFDPTK